jgi:hypothetical protein
MSIKSVPKPPSARAARRPGGVRGPWDRDRSFTPKVRGAIVSGCLAPVLAWAFCPMTFTFQSSLGLVSIGRRSTTCRRGPVSHHAANGSELRQVGTRADQDRGRRLSPRPSPRARSARRGHRGRGPHHRLEEQSDSDTDRRGRRKAGYAWRSQFYSEVAEGVSAYRQ